MLSQPVFFPQSYTSPFVRMGQTESRFDPFSDILVESVYHTLFRSDPPFFETYPYTSSVILDTCSKPPACELLPPDVCKLVRSLCGKASLPPERLAKANEPTTGTITTARELYPDELDRILEHWVSLHPETQKVLRALPDRSVTELRVLVEDVVVPRIRAMMNPSWFRSVYQTCRDVLDVHHRAYGLAYLDVREIHAIVRWHMQTYATMDQTIALIDEVLRTHVRSPMLMDRLLSIGHESLAIATDSTPTELTVVVATILLLTGGVYLWYRSRRQTN